MTLREPATSKSTLVRVTRPATPSWNGGKADNVEGKVENAIGGAFKYLCAPSLAQFRSAFVATGTRHRLYRYRRSGLSCRRVDNAHDVSRRCLVHHVTCPRNISEGTVRNVPVQMGRLLAFNEAICRPCNK
jgi:hypothetical protein